MNIDGTRILCERLTECTSECSNETVVQFYLKILHSILVIVVAVAYEESRNVRLFFYVPSYLHNMNLKPKENSTSNTN